MILSGVDKDQFSGLSGTIPSKFGELKRLKALGIQFTQVSGVIPNTLYQLAKLEEFKCQRGIISGTISESLGGWQLCLLLAFSPFNDHGYISLSVFLCLCLRLYSLSLHSISKQSSLSFSMSQPLFLFSVICACLCCCGFEFVLVAGTFSHLTWFALSENPISGTLPSSIESLTSLNFLW